jgi:N-acetylglutamate synthase/N-acetylornithine aminotransferase
LVLALLVAVPATAVAQGDSASSAAAACAAQKSGLVFSEVFSSPADFGRVLLCAGAN